MLVLFASVCLKGFPSFMTTIQVLDYYSNLTLRTLFCPYSTQSHHHRYLVGQPLTEWTLVVAVVQPHNWGYYREWGGSWRASASQWVY